MSLQGGDLTTLPTAYAYLDSPPALPVLGPLITRASRVILSYINRSFVYPRAYTQQYNGNGTQQLVLANWPVIGNTLTSLTVTGVSIPIAPQVSQVASPTVRFGYRFQPWGGEPPGNVAVVELVGFWFIPGNQNVVVQYNAGYQVSNEVPTNSTWQPLQPYGIWATDQGVTYSATGVALTAISSGIPTIGQYVPPSPEVTPPIPTYTFAAADVSTGLFINYGYIPGDLEQACLDYISERAAYRKRVGIRSQGLASQETFSFDVSSSIPPYIRAMLQPYVTVISPAIGADAI